jgi:hypothetical protein
VQPVLDEATLLQPPAPKYQVTFLSSSKQQQQQVVVSELQLQQEAVAAAAGFRALATVSDGMETEAGPAHPGECGRCQMP